MKTGSHYMLNYTIGYSIILMVLIILQNWSKILFYFQHASSMNNTVQTLHAASTKNFFYVCCLKCYITPATDSDKWLTHWSMNSMAADFKFACMRFKIKWDND